MAATTFELFIKPRRGWQPLDIRELWTFRELLGFLVWRDIKVRYKQTALGGLWAVLQPLIGMVVFGTLFTRVAPIRTEACPYALFIFAGLVPWTFFANAISLASNSLIGSEQMIRKTYFPRLLLPLAATLALALDMLVSLVVMGVLLVVFRWPVTAALAWLPLFVGFAVLSSAGPSFILASLNVRYRDIKYVVPFFTQMALFITPVLYPSRYVPGKLKLFLGLNPMAGVVEGFRHALLGTAMAWNIVYFSAAVSLVLFAAGLFFFRRMERSFADVI